jgi:hypothetical protein
MILLSLCAFIWFKNMKKMLLQMTSSFLQLESTTTLLKLGTGCKDTLVICNSIFFISNISYFIFQMTNAIKVLLQMTSVSLQPVPSLPTNFFIMLDFKMMIGNDAIMDYKLFKIESSNYFKLYFVLHNIKFSWE